MRTFRNSVYVSHKLGVSHTALANWSRNPPEGFIQASDAVEGLDGKINRLWPDGEIANLRSWMAERLGLTNEQAQQRWTDIDNGVTRIKPVGHPGQLLFDIPAQRMSA